MPLPRSSPRQLVAGGYKDVAPLELSVGVAIKSAAMINRVTGEIDFSSGLRIVPHCSLQSLSSGFGSSLKIETHPLSHKDWKRHVLGFHGSEHGNF